MKKHFSHPHPLKLSASALQKDANETEIICSGCEQALTPADDPFYTCSVRGCEFFLHKSCSDLPRNMEHKSHPGHELTLISGSPEYICNACGELISGFSFHCNNCQDFRLHVKCAFLAETLDSKAHKHVLSVEYSSVQKSGSGDDNVAICDVCCRFVKVGYWFFRCKECDFDTHLWCGISAEGPEEDLEGLSEEQRLMRENGKAMDCMAKLQIEMKMADEFRSHVTSVLWGDGSESSSSSSSDDDDG